MSYVPSRRDCPRNAPRGRGRPLLAVAGMALAAVACVGSIGDPPTVDRGTGGRGGGGGASPGGAGGGGAMPGKDPGGCGFAPRRVWKLTPEQYSRSVEA